MSNYKAMESQDQKPLINLEDESMANDRETVPPKSSIQSVGALSNGFNNARLHLDGDGKAVVEEKLQEEFFNSYIDSNVINSDDQPCSSACSDSVSRCDEEQKKPVLVANSAYYPNMNQQNQQIPPPPWYSQIQSDSSSLVTLVSEKKMSDSRRTFCLFVTFDLILTSLLWLIECGASSSSEHTFFNIVQLQIKDFSISNSLFDVVCLSAARFTFLQLMYAWLRIRHWWAVALCTSVTDILLILKVFPIFENSSSPDFLINIPMTIVLLLTNFVLSWIEVWLIDFKVLPAEAKLANRTVQQFLQQSHQQHSVSFAQNDLSEKTPLLRSQRSQGHTPPHSFYTGATSDRASYFSLPESDFGSCHSHHRPRTAKTHQLTKEDYMHVEKGRGALNQLWSLFKNDFVWKVEKELDNGDKLYTTNVPGYGKTFRIDTIVHGVNAQKIFQEVMLKAEVMPEWNKAVDDIKVLKRIGEQTAISLEVSKPAANGLIKSRDFVTVRRVDKIDDAYISAGVSTDYMIPESGRIRGVNGPTGFIVEPCNDGFNSCKFVWILNTNLKGSLPQYLVNSNLSSTMINFVSAMKEFLGAES